MAETLHPKLKGSLWLAGTGLVAGLSVLIFLGAVRQVPRSLEAWMGEKMISFPPDKLCHRPEGVLALRKLVARLYPTTGAARGEEEKLPVTVEVLRDGPVNAFASLGPRIFVYETLIDKAASPDEVAGVIAHELGHVQERHVLEHMAFRVLLVPFWALLSSQGAGFDPRVLDALAQLRYTRAQEYEADVDGLKRLRQADVDPAGLGRFFERLEHETSSAAAMLSDHPSPESRKKLALLYEVKAPRPVLTGAEWAALRGICRD